MATRRANFNKLGKSSSELDSTTTSCEERNRSSSSTNSLKTFVPIRASEWKLKHLNEIGIFYWDQPSKLGDIVTLLKKRVEGRGLSELPDISKRLVEVVKKIWTFSVDFSERDADVRYVALKETDLMMEKLEAEEEILKKQFSCSRNETRLFNICSSNLIAFWRNLKKFIARWTTVKEREAQYTSLFQLFSGISLMDPESGDEVKGTFKIKGVTIHGFPDVRFNSFPWSLDGTLGQMQLIVVTEVKLLKAFHGDYSSETFTAENINGKVLGQHGMELLMERTESFFIPGIVGIICIGTKIVFTYLEIKDLHYSMIQEKGSDIEKSQKSNILYTRPYDFMDVNDRNEILESMFWFGYLQSSSYRAFHL